MSDVPDSLLDAFVNKKATVFVGAGVSRASGLPNWTELLEPLRALIEDCPADASSLDIAQFYVNQEKPRVLADKLLSALDMDKYKPNAIHKVLARLPTDRIYTTNFDDLLERAYRDETGHAAWKVTNNSNLIFNSNRLSVVKLHGDLLDPGTIVLTARDFEDYFEKQAALAQQIAADMFQRSILFIGYSFTDPDTRELLRQTRRRMQEYAPPHFILQIQPPIPVEEELKRRGLKVIRLDGKPDTTTCVLNWLLKLEKRLKDRVTEPPPHVKEAIVKHNLPPEPGSLVGRSEQVSNISESLKRNRIVILRGEPGVGKTSLALKIAHHYAARATDAPFEYVVWVTAREGGRRLLWFNEVLNAIGLTLAFPTVAQTPSSELAKKSMKVNMLLEDKRTLVVLDNFEAMKDDTLLEWVKSVPAASKVLITSRSEIQGLGGDSCVFEVDGLETEVAVELLKRYATASEGGTELRGGEAALRRIAEVTGGNPQAMRLTLGVLQGDRLPFEETISILATHKEDVDSLFNQLFQWAWSVLTFTSEQILLVTALFPSANSMAVEALEASSGLNHEDFATALQQIRRLGLLTDIGEGRYALHPKTRQFALKNLSAWEKFAEGARERCAKYYVKFISDRIVRPKPSAPYWNVLVTDNMKLLDPEWLLIKELMTWAQNSGHGELLVSFVMLMVHYMDSRFLNAERVEFVSSAIQVLSKLPRFADEALLRMDALGWTFVEESRWAEAHAQIDVGCQLAERLQDADLTGLAHAWKARALIEEGKSEEANTEVALALSDASLRSPWIRVRIYMAAGDIAHKQKRHEDALVYFNKSLESASEYDGEGGGYQIYPRIGMTLLNLNDVPEAERRFQALLSLQGIPIGNLYGEYGLALVARKRYLTKDAEARVQHARKELEDRTSSNLLWKLLKDLQSELQSGGAAP